MRKKLKFSDLSRQNTDTESTFEIDLAPMLALMVTLIPIMLLSTQFVKVMVIETALPQAVQKAIEENKEKEEIVSYAVDMSKEYGFKVNIELDGKVQDKIEIPTVNGKWDYEKLYGYLYQQKRKTPKIFKLDLSPQKGVPYAEVVKFMDEVRRVKSTDAKLTFLDTDTNETVATDLLFPDVIFANVLEG